MASKVPFATRIAWGAVILQLIILAACVWVAWRLGSSIPFIVGPAIYLVWSNYGKFYFTMAHRKGIQHVKAGRFEKAIPLFEESADYFERHAWIDRWRALVLLSPSGWGYREMALANRAFCFGQLGRGKDAMEAYEAMLKEYPGSPLAEPALRMMRAAQLSQ
jgi:tetratricopeptide (TPR) repeat protein